MKSAEKKSLMAQALGRGIEVVMRKAQIPVCIPYRSYSTKIELYWKGKNKWIKLLTLSNYRKPSTGGSREWKTIFYHKRSKEISAGPRHKAESTKGSLRRHKPHKPWIQHIPNTKAIVSTTPPHQTNKNEVTSNTDLLLA